MSYSTDERYDVYHEVRVIARKQHECDAVMCSEPIRKGDNYWRISVVYDGRAETIKRCIRCQHIHVHLRGLCEPDEQWPDERLNCGLTYENEWGTVPPEIAALAFWRPGDSLPAVNQCTAVPNRYPGAGPVLACWGSPREWNPATGHCRPERFDWQRPSQPSGYTEVC